MYTSYLHGFIYNDMYVQSLHTYTSFILVEYYTSGVSKIILSSSAPVAAAVTGACACSSSMASRYGCRASPSRIWKRRPSPTTLIDADLASNSVSPASDAASARKPCLMRSSREASAKV